MTEVMFDRPERHGSLWDQVQRWAILLAALTNVGVVGAWIMGFPQSVATLTIQLNALQASVSAIQTQIASLPVQASILTQLQDHIHAVDARLDDHDSRLRALEQTQAAQTQEIIGLRPQQGR